MFEKYYKTLFIGFCNIKQTLDIYESINKCIEEHNLEISYATELAICCYDWYPLQDCDDATKTYTKINKGFQDVIGD